MTEVFKPRDNMTYNIVNKEWLCFDKAGHYVCDGGPSRIWDNGRGWDFYTTLNGFHRLDGPSSSYGSWHINGKNITKEIHQFAKENEINLKNLTDEDKVLIALKFG